MNKEIKKVLFSSMVGNALEWYDFVIFAQFSPYIGKLFFSIEDKNSALLAALAVFAVGFVMRPLGGVLFGIIGDKYGRKISIISSILLMSIPTTIIGLLPTFEQIGILSTILLTAMRLCQGLALGGGFSGCMTFLLEHAPDNQKGLIGSASMFSLGAGVLLGLLVTIICINNLDVVIFETWGWRVPFVISCFIGLIAFYIKNNVQESPVFLEAKKNKAIKRAKLGDLLKNHRKNLLLAIAVYLAVTVPFYSFSAFFNLFLQKILNYSFVSSLTINAIAIIFFMISVPISGYCSDKYGQVVTLKYSVKALIIVVLPVFFLLISGKIILALIGQIMFAVCLGFYMGATPSFLIDLFPVEIRYTGLSLSYNISAALFGGTVPVVLFWLINNTGSNYAPVLYIIIFCLVTLYALNKASGIFDCKKSCN